MNPSAVPPKQPDRRKIPSDGFLFLNPSESRTGAGVRYGSDCRKTLLEKSLAELSRPQTTEGKEASVISGDTCVGNDTSHDGQGDFSARIEPCPSCIPRSKKARGLFRQAETGSGPARRGGASAPLAQTLGAKRIHFARAFEIKG